MGTSLRLFADYIWGQTQNDTKGENLGTVT